MLFDGGKAKREREAELLRLRQADAYVRLQDMNAKGELAISRPWVACLSYDGSMRARVAGLLTEAIKQHGYMYLEEPSVIDAVHSAVLLMDVRPKIDSRMHAHYDKVLRIKKSMGKFGKDFLGVIGARRLSPNYPRGTYGEIYMFCHDEDEPEAYDRNLPPDGLKEIGGPILVNFIDMPYVIGKWMGE